MVEGVVVVVRGHWHCHDGVTWRHGGVVSCGGCVSTRRGGGGMGCGGWWKMILMVLMSVRQPLMPNAVRNGICII